MTILLITSLPIPGASVAVVEMVKIEPMEDERDDIPTMMVTTPDNYLVMVGDPSVPTRKELAEYAWLGYTIKTVPFKVYRESGIKWIYSKVGSSQISETLPK